MRVRVRVRLRALTYVPQYRVRVRVRVRLRALTYIPQYRVRVRVRVSIRLRALTYVPQYSTFPLNPTNPNCYYPMASRQHISCRQVLLRSTLTETLTRNSSK